MNVGIVGCGLIGEKRARALAGARAAAFCDVDLAKATRLADRYPGARAFARWEDLVSDPDIDIVVVATSNEALAPIATAAAKAGKHVMVEKPGARTLEEITALADAATASGVHVHVGFNHRFHSAIYKARELVTQGALGPLMFMRGRYGHGGRVGYDREWRADPARSGGGELMDQGVHLIDLARWFLGDFPHVQGFAATYFWDMPVDDNAFLTLRTATGTCAFLHVSCTEWKNMFSLEIYGRDGKLQIDGLGGSYGLERLTFYKMLPEMGPPETTSWEYPRGDQSWDLEFAAFLRAIGGAKSAGATVADARRALEIVHHIYHQQALP